MSQKLGSQLVVGTALSLTMTMPLHAQGGAAVPKLQIDPWAGFYVSLGLSHETGIGNLSGYGTDQYCSKGCENITLSDRHDFFHHGFNGEVELGYNKTVLNGWVLGGSVNLALHSGLSVHRHITDTYTAKDASVFNPELDYFAKIDGSISALARVGLPTDMTRNTMIYLLGGFSWAHYSIGGRYDAGAGGGEFDWGRKGFTPGLTWGIGIEKLFGPMTSFGLEFRQTQFRSVSASFDSSPQFGQTDFHPTLNSLTAKVTFHIH